MYFKRSGFVSSERVCYVSSGFSIGDIELDVKLTSSLP